MEMAESYGTIWVCVDCLMHHANGECGSCHDKHGHDEEPLSAIGDGFHVAMGMSYEEHAETCARRPLGCTECSNPATHAVWWQNEDGTREGEPRCGEFECMSTPDDAVAGGTAPIPTPFPVPDNYVCDCETNTFNMSQCEGCGSWLHGERHAMTLFKVDVRPATPPVLEDTPTLLRRLYDAARDV
jgi:hypothetical protein